jgi:DNA-binding CsgD family transcriptional regulator
MVGRREVLAELRALLRGVVAADSPPVAVLTGEAGIGKTRLLRELIGEMGPDVPVVAGQAREGDVRRSFALVRDAVEEHLDPDGRLPGELDRWAHPLGHLLAPLVVVHDHPSDGHEHQQEELTRAGVALLRHLAGDGPALVAFEDVHWGDGGSLEVLGRLARTGAPLLLVVTFRPEEFHRHHPLSELLSDLERQAPVTHLTVEGLTRPEFAELLEEVAGGPFPTGAVDRLHRRTRGNPFFLEELVAGHGLATRGQARRPAIDPGSLAEAPLPWSTKEAVLRRLDALEARPRGVLQTAAVLGERFDLGVLAPVLGEDEQDVLETLAQLVHDGLLVEHSAATFGFRHALTREAAVGGLLASERRAVHARVLSLMAAGQRGDAAAMAQHALAAGDVSRAASHAREAARDAAHAGAPRVALRFAGMALEHGADDASMHELAAHAAGYLGEFEQAGEHAEAWRVLAADAGDAEGEALAGCQLAWMRFLAGRHDAASEALSAAVAVADELDPGRARAEVLAAHARFLLVTKRAGEAVRRADEAIEVAERVPAPRTLVKAWLHKCAGILDSLEHQRPADLELAATLIDRAREESARLGEADTLAGALHNRLVPDQPDDLPIERSWELLAEAKQVADRYGLERLADKTAVLEAHLAVVDGDRERAETSLAAARRVQLAAFEANWCEALDAHLGLESGDLDRAQAAHARQHELLRPPYRSAGEMDLVTVAAALARHRGDVTGAEEALRRAGRLVPDVCPCVAAGWWEAALAALDTGVGPDLVGELMDREAPPTVPRHAGLIEHVRGALHAARDDPREAIAALQRSLGHERRQRRAALLADAHHRLGELLGARGQRERAHAHVAAALGLLERWPGVHRTRVEALQRRLGEGERPVHELLTPRELEVVELVARGFTNSDIAEHLFITRKTASTHISNILDKTGFERRTQVAIWAVQEGITDA